MPHFPMSTDELPQSIPLFPLDGALLLPRARLPLHIFEPRYKEMLRDVLGAPGRLIGMVQNCPTPQAQGGKCLHRIGCAGRVVSFSETEDGRYMISLSGVCRFRLLKSHQCNAGYMKAEVEWAGFEADLCRCEQCDPAFDREDFLGILQGYLRAKGLSSDWDSLLEADAELLVNSLSMLCPFEVEEKQALLEAPDLATRRETLVSLFKIGAQEAHSGFSHGPMQ